MPLAPIKAISFPFFKEIEMQATIVWFYENTNADLRGL
jgi:hypothetical protein